MNDRERWIVYPLLFLALGAALRDKLIKQTRAKEIVCETLYLVDSEGRQMAFLNGSTLRFDIEGGVGNGFIRSNVIDADAITQRGQRVSTGGGGGGGVKLPLQDLLRMLPQLRLPPGMVPSNPQNPPKQPPAAGEPPESDPLPPDVGPTLQAPAEPTGDA